MGGVALLTDRRQAIAGCAAALRDLHTVLFQCGSADLSGLAGDLAEVRALCGAQLAAVVAEAEMRGVIDSSQCANTSAWVAEHAWHSRREATTVAKTARLLRRRDLAPAADAVLTGDVDLGTARSSPRNTTSSPPTSATTRNRSSSNNSWPSAPNMARPGSAGCGRRFWRATARTTNSRNIRRNADGLLTCPPATKPQPGSGNIDSSPTTRAAPSSRRRSGRCPRPSPDPDTGRRDPRSGRAAPRRGPDRSASPSGRRRAARARHHRRPCSCSP